MLADGWVDTFRFKHPEREKAFTCWNSLTEARRGNFGTRIDYCVVSATMKEAVKEAEVWQHVHGSDHCPVALNLDVSKMMLLTPTFSPRESHHSTAAIRAPTCTRAMKHLEEQPKLTGFFGNTAVASTTTIDKKKDVSSFIETSSPMKTKEVVPPLKVKDVTPSKRSRPTDSAASITSQQQRDLTSFFVKPPPVKKINLASSPPPKAKIEKEYQVPESVLEAIREADALEAQQHADNLKNKLKDNIVLEPKHDRNQSELPKKPVVSAFDRLLKPLPPPLCAGHQEPCREFTVNKTGPNQGKKFYLCARPVGPSHEKHGEWRCDTFIWKNALAKKHMK